MQLAWRTDRQRKSSDYSGALSRVIRFQRTSKAGAPLEHAKKNQCRRFSHTQSHTDFAPLIEERCSYLPIVAIKKPR